MLCSALTEIPSRTVPSTYFARPCSITSAPHLSQSWENNSSHSSSTLPEDIQVLPIKVPPSTSYMEKAWVVIGLEVDSLKIDNGSSDTCPARNGPNLLRADLLPYCLTNSSQNELHGGRFGSLISLFTGHESYPEYLLKGLAGDSQGFFIPNFAELLPILLISAILVLELLLVRSRSKQLRLLWSNKHDLDAWALGFAKISQVYERFCQNLEPGVPAGKTRIRWKCLRDLMKRCGRRLYDDFEELRPGAIAELERSLNKAGEVTNNITITRHHDLENQEKVFMAAQGMTVARVTKYHPTNFYKILALERMTASKARIDMARLKLDLMTKPEVPKTYEEIFGLKEQVRVDLSKGTFHHSTYDPDTDTEPLVKSPMDSSSTGGTIQSQSTGLGDLSPLAARDISAGGKARSVRSHRTQTMPKEASEAPNPPHPESLFLLLCIPHRKYATRLIHMDVCTLLSDRLFFKNLKSQYRSMRGRWVSFFSLKQLRSIRFVKFEMYPSTLVDIRKINDIPPETHRHEYRYRPIPAEVIPPVGENHLMHLYDHPEDAEDTAICLDKVPKKLRERLGVCPQRGTGLGWGIHFVEGLHWTKLWILGFIGLLMSIAFGIAWACVRNDVQGGFGIAACMMVGLTFTTGIVQAALEPK